MHLPRVSARLLLVLTLFTLPLAAQYSERVDVSIANIDVVVRDNAGRLVRGLTKGDFEVYENGELQTITNFSAIDVRASGGVTSRGAEETTPARAARLPRLLVLFFDVKEIDPRSRMEFFQAIRAFVDTTLREGDFATIMAWNNRVRVVLPPTSDRTALDAVVDEFAKQGFSPVWETLRRVQESRLVHLAEAGEFAGQMGMLPASDLGADAAFEDFISTEERCVKLKRKAREMRNLLAHLTKIEMKKVLLFASDDASLKPSETCDTTTELAAMANTANAYGITIHGLHPPGQRARFIGPDQGGFLPKTDAPAPMAEEYARVHNETGGLALLARSTGGVFGIGRQSDTQLRRAAEELDIYYSIGYSLSPGNEDKPRQMKVVTKNAKYGVRTRDSVVRLSEGARLRDEIATNLYFPGQVDPQSPAFNARVVRIERDGRLLRAAVELSIRSGDLFVTEKKGSFSVFVAGGRELGDASAVIELRQDFEAIPDADAAAPIIYSFETRIRPDTRRLSFGVRDNNTGEVATTIVLLKSEG